MHAGPLLLNQLVRRLGGPRSGARGGLGSLVAAHGPVSPAVGAGAGWPAWPERPPEGVLRLWGLGCRV